MSDQKHYGVQYSKMSKNPERLTSDKRSENSVKHISNVINYLDQFQLHQQNEGSWKFSTVIQGELMHSMFNVKLVDRDHFKIVLDYFKTNKSRLVCQQVLNEIEKQKIVLEKQDEPSSKILKRINKMFKVIDKNQREIMAEKGNLQLKQAKEVNSECSSD